jgi:hypothetical protein
MAQYNCKKITSFVESIVVRIVHWSCHAKVTDFNGFVRVHETVATSEITERKINTLR